MNVKFICLCVDVPNTTMLPFFSITTVYTLQDFCTSHSVSVSAAFSKLWRETSFRAYINFLNTTTS